MAKKWFASAGHNLDGVIAKRLDVDYRSGDRSGMVKIKNLRTAECVVGGYRYGSKATKTLGSLLLGLYDDEGKLNHVGFCSSLTAKQRAWWQAQRTYGLSRAVRQSAEQKELELLGDALETPTGRKRLGKLLGQAHPKEYRAVI